MGVIMKYQISKYEAIKAVLKAEEEKNIKLVNQMMLIIRRAARKEIKQNKYKTYYTINDHDKKYFEKATYTVLNPGDDSNQ